MFDVRLIGLRESCDSDIVFTIFFDFFFRSAYARGVPHSFTVDQARPNPRIYESQIVNVQEIT